MGHQLLDACGLGRLAQCVLAAEGGQRDGGCVAVAADCFHSASSSSLWLSKGMACVCKPLWLGAVVLWLWGRRRIRWVKRRSWSACARWGAGWARLAQGSRRSGKALRGVIARGRCRNSRLT